MAGLVGLEVASQPRLRCPATRCSCISLADRGASLRSLHPPPAALATSPGTLRVPRVLFFETARKPPNALCDEWSVMAGAEGLEPSARGFGGHVKFKRPSNLFPLLSLV